MSIRIALQEQTERCLSAMESESTAVFSKDQAIQTLAKYKKDHDAITKQVILYSILYSYIHIILNTYASVFIYS